MSAITEKTTVTIGVLVILAMAYGWLNSKFASMEIRQITTDAKVEALLSERRAAWTRADMALWQEMFARLNPTLAVPKIPDRQ